MVEGQSITIAPGVTRADCRWGYLLKGSKAALTAAKVPAEWLPDGIERNVRGQVIRTRHIERIGQKIRATQEQKNKISVYVETLHAEGAIRDDRRQRAMRTIERAERFLESTRAVRRLAAARADSDFQLFLRRAIRGAE